MAFPDTPLPIVTEMFIDGAWVNVTADEDDNDGGSRVRGTEAITITRGRPNEAARSTPGRCRFGINNRDGKYSDRNPSSPYYHKLGRNVPTRVRVTPNETYLRLPYPYGGENRNERAHAEDAAALDITGDIDVRIDVDFEEWTRNSLVLMSKYLTTGDSRSWLWYITSDGFLTFSWTTAGTFASLVTRTATAAVTPAGRIALRVALDADNDSSGHDVSFYTADDIDSSWTQVGSTVTTAGTTSIHSGSAQVEIGSANEGSSGFTTLDHPMGRVYAAQVRDSSGTLVVDADFRDVEVGVAGVDDGLGNTWVIGAPARIASDRVRFYGEASVSLPDWDKTGRDVRVTIDAAGIFRRLGQNLALRSPLYRYIRSHSPVAHWPLEDEVGTQRPAAAVSGVQSAGARGVTFGAVDDLLGSQPTAQIGSTSARMGAAFPAYAGTDSWTFTFSVKLPAAPASTTEIMRLGTSGTGRSWRFLVTSTTYEIEVRDDQGTVLDSAAFTFGDGAEPGQWVVFVVEATQSGSDVSYEAAWHPVDVEVFYSTGAQSFAGTVGSLASWNVSGSTGNLDAGYAHIAGASHLELYETLNHNYFHASAGWRDEAAADRIERLCREEGIPYDIVGVSHLTPTMGRQTAGNILDLLQECADVDMGLLTEGRDFPGVLYVCRRAMQNRTGAELSHSNHHLSQAPGVVEDDQTLANIVIVTRKEGSSHRSELATGKMSTAAHPDGIGPYEKAVTVNVTDDRQLADQAGWRLHIGTWDEPRFAGIRVQLERAPFLASESLTNAILATDVGQWLALRDLPPGAGSSESDVIVQGYAEKLGAHTWDLTYNSAPAGPYRVSVLGTAPKRLIGSTTSALDGDVTSSGTSLSVSSECLWSTSAAGFDIEVGGEKMTVTAISGTTSPQTFTVTRSVNGIAKSHSAGTKVRLWTRTFIGV